MAAKYDVFVRTWWKNNSSGEWPNNLEPHLGRRKYIARNVSAEEARKIAGEYNSSHNPGRFSRKAEFESR